MEQEVGWSIGWLHFFIHNGIFAITMEASVLRFEVHGVEHEGPLVGLLVEDFGGGLAGAVAGIGLDADQHRIGASVGGL